MTGFDAKEVSMDIVSPKTKECVGYTTFRNAMVEQRIKLIELHELLKEITNLEKNETTGKVDHPRQTVKIIDGMTIKSVGKDEADSLGGAIYNATISVNLDELDYLDGVTITDSSTVLNADRNNANQFFGITTDVNGRAVINTNDIITEQEEVNVNDQIDLEINGELYAKNKVVEQIRKSNPKTKLTDKQILDLYGDFNSDGFIII